MEVYRRSSWLLLLLGVSLLATTLQVVQGEAEFEGPSESECRPYIEKALKELETGDIIETPDDISDSKEDLPTIEITTDDNDHQQIDVDDDDDDGGEDDQRDESEQKSAEDADNNDDQIIEQEDTQTHASEESKEESTPDADTKEEEDGDIGGSDEVADKKSDETVEDATESEEQPQQDAESNDSDEEEKTQDAESEENQKASHEETESVEIQPEKDDSKEQSEEQRIEEPPNVESEEDTKEDDKDSKETTAESIEDKVDSKEDDANESVEAETIEGSIEAEAIKESVEEVETTDEKSVEQPPESGEDDTKSSEQPDTIPDVDNDKDESKETEDKDKEKDNEDSDEQKDESKEDDDDDGKESGEDTVPEEALGIDAEIPTELRPREHVEHLLKLDDESSETENVIIKIADITLRELKKLYENAIKPLETLYKYRDLSNRHFGDAEIFSKPLILFMGPWSGGKSSIINYLLNNEYNETSLRTGAEPSPAYFNILMYGDEPEVIDGTQLAADFTFSGLQKFGQGLEERLRGIKLPSKILEKVNIVEIPGILEVRKQISRVFPFNDACQWFIDRADIIFLVYDPSKLDVGPETEAILDQLKGREHQTRIILNKADQVKPEELMRVQGSLIWNISPLMSSAQPPVMYTTSLWSRPYEAWAPIRLLQAQERAFLRDLRSAIEKRIENKIASARRFAVRVRNHAKMVDCYLTTYYNHKSVFGNRKQVADQIIEHPQDYHIYEGLSTLTNISRYDLPDPDVYRDFFKLNPLYDFQQLSATCTYFRGCPINRLDVAIAYDLPELVGKHKRFVESALAEINNQTTES